MHLHIYSLEKTLYDGTADAVTLPAEDGEITVLPHHMRLVTTLKNGVLTLQEKGKKEKVPIQGGFAYTDGLQLVVLAD
jgi:F-type H+-transporting ATPase subunit epsilon